MLFQVALQTIRDARAAAPKLKDVVDGGVTLLVPSSTADSLPPAEKKVSINCQSRNALTCHVAAVHHTREDVPCLAC